MDTKTWVVQSDGSEVQQAQDHQPLSGTQGAAGTSRDAEGRRGHEVITGSGARVTCKKREDDSCAHAVLHGMHVRSQAMTRSHLQSVR